MGKMRVGLIGTGGRSRLYLDALKRLPDDFEVVSMRFRTEEKAKRFAAEYNIPVTTSLDEFKSVKPDFIVDLVNRPDVGKVALDFLNDDIPVLAETPPAESFEEIRSLWELTEKRKSKILVAENYFAEPMHAARIEAVRRGYLGEMQTVTVSNTHEYHAVSVIRLMLDALYTPLTVLGKKMAIKLTLTQDKEGNAIRDGRTQDVDRYHMFLSFENGRTGIYDFAIAQYWSSIRSRYFMAQGSRGEIKDDDILFLDKDFTPQKSKFEQKTTSSGDLISISIGDDVVYENTLLSSKGVGRGLGISHMLLNMKTYLETGKAPYSFASAMQDTYITQLILEAGRKPFQPVPSEKMPWH